MRKSLRRSNESKKIDGEVVTVRERDRKERRERKEEKEKDREREKEKERAAYPVINAPAVLAGLPSPPGLGVAMNSPMISQHPIPSSVALPPGMSTSEGDRDRAGTLHEARPDTPLSDTLGRRGKEREKEKDKDRSKDKQPEYKPSFSSSTTGAGGAGGGGVSLLGVAEGPGQTGDALGLRIGMGLSRVGKEKEDDEATLAEGTTMVGSEGRGGEERSRTPRGVGRLGGMTEAERERLGYVDTGVE
ncbi:hypothetical protein BDZ91DRAFT_737665 [Kalaharituber pfeilii]|nr:hypothetical protein BDZ91DRAFT_737665 [Kalaharituber pfeilii]